MAKKYVIKFFFEVGVDTPFWPGNDATDRDLGIPIDPAKLSLSGEVVRRVSHLTAWHDRSLNWDHPPDPGPWRQDECDRFNAEAAELLELVAGELGEEYEIVDRFTPLREDPELDRYLTDPGGFRR